ncbi:hypothetical protein PLESTM_002037900 [Pleodorina starrii]|nr:hypothetical protein PLESTM_002037900 [Pleodorina starrii]
MALLCIGVMACRSGRLVACMDGWQAGLDAWLELGWCGVVWCDVTSLPPPPLLPTSPSQPLAHDSQVLLGTAPPASAGRRPRRYTTRLRSHLPPSPLGPRHQPSRPPPPANRRRRHQ